MVEPITTGAAALAAAWISKDGVQKLLGPSADYLGGEIKNLVEKSHKNIASIFKCAERKAGQKLELPGSVNPRVLKHVLDEGRFTEENLFAEYFGGVLASARTPDGSDDRGAYYAQIVQGMSVYQLKFHYMFYFLMWNLAKGKVLNLNTYTDREKIELIVPVQIVQENFKIENPLDMTSIFAHALAGLSRLGLIEDGWKFESPETFKSSGILVKSHSFFVAPSLTGLELFVWAHGHGDLGVQAFLTTGLVTSDELQLKLTSLARFKTSEEAQANGTSTA